MNRLLILFVAMVYHSAVHKVTGSGGCQPVMEVTSAKVNVDLRCSFNSVKSCADRGPSVLA